GIVMLRKAVEADLGVVSSLNDAQRSLSADIRRRSVVRGNHSAAGISHAFIGCAIEVIRRRQHEDDSGAQRAQPGKTSEDILLTLAIPNTQCLRFGCVGNLVAIGAGSADKTKLIVGRGIEDERGEYSAAIAQVMEIVAGGR